MGYLYLFVLKRRFSRKELGIFAVRSVRAKLLLNCCTAADEGQVPPTSLFVLTESSGRLYEKYESSF